MSAPSIFSRRAIRTILFIVQKETLQVVRDRIMVVQIFAAPIIQLVILAQAMTFEVKHTDLALVDLDRSSVSERLIEQFTSTGRFQVIVPTASSDIADEALMKRQVNAILRIPEGFARELRRGRAPSIQLILNAEDGAAAGVIQSYAMQILAEYSLRMGGEIGGASELSPAAPAALAPKITTSTRTLYNPQRGYLKYMAIGLLVLLVTLVGVLLTAQNITREKEIGTLEQLNVTPITKAQFIAGKLLPFWALGLIELTVGLSIIRFGFGITFEGSVVLVYLGAAVYLFAALGIGLLISTVADTLQQAQFLTFFVLVTFIFLGGVFTPIQSMPRWAQTTAQFNPVKHFVYLLRAVLMKGGGLDDVAGAIGAMAGFAVVVLSLAVIRYRKTAA